MKKILITGSAGFIGFHLTKKLSLLYNIVCFDSINDYYDTSLKYARLAELVIPTNKIKYNEPVENGNIIFYQLNLEDKKNIFRLFEKHKFDYVIHLAAQAGVRYSLSNPDAYIQSNFAGFLNMLEACRKYTVEHFIYASTSSVYGLNQQYPFSETQFTDHPISLYSASKKSNELMAHTYSHLFNIPTTGLRFFTVYGPWGRPDMALFIFTKNILENKPIQVFNNGDMIRDFTYMDDITESIYRLLELPPQRNNDYSLQNPQPAGSTAPYKIYNIGNNSPVNLMDFIHEIENETGKKAVIEYLPMQAGDVSKTFADSSSLYSKINFKPSTSYKEGIHNFVKWFREYYGM